MTELHPNLFQSLANRSISLVCQITTAALRSAGSESKNATKLHPNWVRFLPHQSISLVRTIKAAASRSAGTETEIWHSPAHPTIRTTHSKTRSVFTLGGQISYRFSRKWHRATTRQCLPTGRLAGFTTIVNFPPRTSCDKTATQVGPIPL